MARFVTSSGFGRQMRNACRASQSVAQTSMKRDSPSSFDSRSQFLGTDLSFQSSGRPTRHFTPPGVRATLMMDHFATLGVRQNASKSEIKSAYRNLAKQYHPDVCRGDQCQIKFIQISTAYEHALNCLTGPSSHAMDHSWDDCFTDECREELEDWEEWMGWEGAGTLDYTS